MSVSLIPYESWHLMAMFNKGSSPISVDDVLFLSVLYKNRGTAYTVIEDDKILGSAGILRLWGNVGEVWTFLTDDLRRKPFSLHRIAKRMLYQIRDVAGYHRLQTTVKSDNEVAVNWVERMGMIKEATLKQFGPDKADYDMYSMVR